MVLAQETEFISMVQCSHSLVSMVGELVARVIAITNELDDKTIEMEGVVGPLFGSGQVQRCVFPLRPLLFDSSLNSG